MSRYTSKYAQKALPIPEKVWKKKEIQPEKKRRVSFREPSPESEEKAAEVEETPVELEEEEIEEP